LLKVSQARDVLEELLEREVVEDRIGSLREALVDQVDGDFAGRAVGSRGGFFGVQSTFETSDEVAYDDLLGRSGEAISPAAADFAFEEPASAEGEEDGFEKFVGEVLLVGEVFGLDELAGTLPRQGHDGAETVFGSFREAHVGVLLVL
jgi:hypothetical protein